VIEGKGKVDLRYLRIHCKSGVCLQIKGDVDVTFRGVEMYLDPSDFVPVMLDIVADSDGNLPRLHFESPEGAQYPGLMIIPHPFGREAMESAIARRSMQTVMIRFLPFIDNMDKEYFRDNILRPMGNATLYGNLLQNISSRFGGK